MSSAVIHKLPEEKKFSKNSKSPSFSKFTKTPFNFHSKVNSPWSLGLTCYSRFLKSTARFKNFQTFRNQMRHGHLVRVWGWKRYEQQIKFKRPQCIIIWSSWVWWSVRIWKGNAYVKISWKLLQRHSWYSFRAWRDRIV